MARFPFFREMSGRRALVAGGGEVALRRACALSDCGAEVTAVAPQFCAGFENARIRCERRGFEMSDLDGAEVVVAATDDRELNARIGKECRQRGIEVNVSDDPSACTFYFPGLVRRGSLTVGISTDGASPIATRFVRERIEAAIPERFEDILACMEKARSIARNRIDDQRKRSKILNKAFEYCLQADEIPDERVLEEMIHRFECTEID